MKYIFLSLFFFSITLSAQSADEIIKNVQHKFDTIENLSANFTQSVLYSESSNSIKFSGKFFFMKPNSFRIELPDREIISDGSSVWNYDKKQNKIVISEAVTDEVSFSLTDIIYSYPNKCDLSLIKSDDSGFTIKAVPNKVELAFNEAIFKINKNYILTKIIISDYNEMKYSFELLSVKLNGNLDKNLFLFNPSKKVEVIDLR